jgi:hypothetical protein
MWHVLADFDGNTVGLGTVSGALVIALGYMLRDRRDSDKRVDSATSQVVKTIADERDRALKAEAVAYAARDTAVRERDEAEKQLNLLGYRLQTTEAQLKALQGDTP